MGLYHALTHVLSTFHMVSIYLQVNAVFRCGVRSNDGNGDMVMEGQANIEN